MTDIKNWRKPSVAECAWALSKLQPLAETLGDGPRSDEGWLVYCRLFLRIVQPIPERRIDTENGPVTHPAVSLEEATDMLVEKAGSICTRMPRPVQMRKMWMHNLRWPSADGVEMVDIEDDLGGEVRL